MPFLLQFDRWRSSRESQRPVLSIRATAIGKVDRPQRVDSDIERPVSATSRRGRFAVQSVDTQDAPPLVVVACHSKSEALGSRF
jgi:hypothetical protein